MDKEQEWSTYNEYISRFGLDLANDLLGMTAANAAHEYNVEKMDASSPDISWGSGFDHFGNGSGGCDAL